MKGYIGFSRGLICDGKQYVEDSVYEDDEGILFYQSPKDVIVHFGFTDENGELHEFAEVEILDEIKTAEDACYTRKLKIGKKLSVADLAQAYVSYTLENTAYKQSEVGIRSVATNTDWQSVATTTGSNSAATNTGDSSAAMSKGDWSTATNMGDFSIATNSGTHSIAAAAGAYSVATNTGGGSTATTTGSYSAAANSANCSIATSTGYHSVATNTGWLSVAANTGKHSVATNTGNLSVATNTGDESIAAVEGIGSIAIATGIESKAKGSLGCWLVIAEHDNEHHIVSVVSAKVDGTEIKPDTFYIAKNGKLVEASSDANSETTSFFG